MIRVLVVSTVHHPLDARIHHRQVRALRRAGCSVTQIGPWAATGTSPLVDGVVAGDVPRSEGRRRLRALRHARQAIVAGAGTHDLVLLHDPELVLAVAGIRRRLPPVVLDVHEDLAASLADRSWLPRPLVPVARVLARGLERWAERHLAGLLLAEASYRTRFRWAHPVVANLPWIPEQAVASGTARRVVYVGRVSVGRGAHELLELARLRRADDPVLEVVGPADPAVRAQFEQAHADGLLTWWGRLPNDAALERVRGSVAGLAPLHDLPNYRGSLPTKVLEYLAYGIPAIVTPLPLAAAIIERSGAGEVVAFADPEALLAAVRRFDTDAELRDRAGSAGRDYLRTTGTSWDAGATSFVDHLVELARRGRARAAHPSVGAERSSSASEARVSARAATPARQSARSACSAGEWDTPVGLRT